MKKLLFLILVLSSMATTFAQSNKIVPIILDGKPAYMNTTTGKIVSKKEAQSKKYKKINLNNFSDAFSHRSETASLTDESGLHTVRSGETLYAISRKSGTSVAKLKALNGLSSNVIRVGQVLQTSIKTDVVAAVESTSNSTHIVTSGDTLYAIAKKYGISVTHLKELNNLIDNNIHIGDELIVE